MPQPRERTNVVYVTDSHLHDAIKAGVAPLQRDVDRVRNDLTDVAEVVATIADDLTELSIRLDARRRRIRRWLATNADRAAVKALEAAAIAGAAAAATYLLTHL